MARLPFCCTSVFLAPLVWRVGFRVSFATLAACLLLAALLAPTVPVFGDDGDEPSADSLREPSFQPSASPNSLLVASPPPPLGGVIFEDALNSAAHVPGPFACSSGNGGRDIGADGYVFRLSGRCTANGTTAFLTLGPVRGLEVPDGDVRVEYRVLNGHDRVRVHLFTRFATVDGCTYGYSGRVNESRTVALFAFNGCGADTIPSLVSRSNLQDHIFRDDWNSLAVRAQGPNIWVYHNDELMVSAADAARDRGSVAVRVARTGDINDTEEVAVAFRNLRVSRLARVDGAQNSEVTP